MLWCAKIFMVVLLVLNFCACSSFLRPKSVAQFFAEPLVLEPQIAKARTHFRRNEFRLALDALQNKYDDDEARLIAAESLYRLGQCRDAEPLYEQFARSGADAVVKRKAAIRLFDIEICEGDTSAAINRYVKFVKVFKNPSAQMRYALGLAMVASKYDDRAQKILSLIPEGSEYYLRARYIMYTLMLEKDGLQASLKNFSELEAVEPISVEDYVVHELVILAQGRIYNDLEREDLAAKAYERVSLTKSLGETATIEIIRSQLQRRQKARAGIGKYQKIPPAAREKIANEAVTVALAAISRFRKQHEITWQRSELLTLTAQVYVEVKRYEEARVMYEELINHCRPIYLALMADAPNEDIWPYFALDTNKERGAIVRGLPDQWIKDLPEIAEIDEFRNHYLENEIKLRELEENAGRSAKIPELIAARQRQADMAAAYKTMVIKNQPALRSAIAAIINDRLAEADFKRPELVVLEMKDLEKQEAVVHEFQNEKLNLLEQDLRKLDQGGQ